MSLEGLALKRRTPLEFEFKVAEGLVPRGSRSFYQVSFLDQTDDLSSHHSSLFGLAERTAVEFARELTKTSRLQPFDRVDGNLGLSVLDEDAGQLYLDVLSSLPKVQKREFGQALAAAKKDLVPRVRAAYQNALKHEPNFKNALYLARFTLNSMLIPGLINDALKKKAGEISPDELAAAQRSLATVFTYLLGKAVDPKLRDEMRDRFNEVVDPHPYLNGNVSEFVLAGMEPTNAEVARGLSILNPYGINTTVHGKIKTVMKGLLGDNYESYLTNPANIEKILKDPESIEQIRKAIGDFTPIVASTEAAKVARSPLRQRFAAGYNEPAFTVFLSTTAMDGILKNGNRPDFYQKIRTGKQDLDDAIRDQIERGAANVARANKDVQVQTDAIKLALAGSARLLTNAALYYEFRRLARGVEFLVPSEGETLSVADQFKNRNAYVFAASGPIFAGSAKVPAASEAGAPAARSADRDAVFFADIRGFTELMNKYGAQSIGSYVNTFLAGIGQAALDNGAEHVKYAADAVIAIFSKEDRVRRCMATAGNVQGLLTSHNVIAKGKGDLELNMGIGITSGETVILSGLPAPNGMQEDFYGAHLNLSSRLSTRAHPEVEEMLEKMAYRPLDELAQQAVQMDNSLVDRFVIRKTEPYVRRTIVLEDGRYHSKGILLEEPIVDMLGKEVTLQSRELSLTEEERRNLNEYFDPSKITNASVTPAVGEKINVLYFFDTKSGKMALLKHQPKLKAKGFAPVAVYELLPFTSFVYSRLSGTPST